MVTPSCSIGVTTMKMIRSTRQMSTKGVTLMSELSPLLPSCMPMLHGPLSLTLQEEVDELGGAVRHLDAEELQLPLEVVEHPDCENRDREPDGRRDERLGDTGRDRPDAARSAGGHAREGVDDADDRAEQADERRRRSDGRQSSDAPFHLGGGEG